MMKRLLMLAFLLGWLLLPTVACAQGSDPYEGEVAVASQSEADRLAALGAALAQVIAKRTGMRGAADDPRLAGSLGRAGEWLQRYRYLDGAGGGVVLVARFDPAAVDRTLSEAGLTVWPEPRPQPVVWLAIDDGRGPRLLGNSQAQAVAALTARASQRGLRLTYPLMDLQDQQQIDVDRVWSADSSAAIQAARRYQSNVVLLGRLFRDGSQWIAEWRIVQDGEVLDQQRSSDADSSVVLANGADLAASALVTRYAADLNSAGPPGRYPLRVSGVLSAQDYARLLGQLNRMASVRATEITGADGDALLLTLDLTSGIEGFSRSARGIGLLAADESAAASTGVLPEPVHRFVLLP